MARKGIILIDTYSSLKVGKYSIFYKKEEYSSPKPAPEELVCPICHELLGEPQQTTQCGHIFCKECLIALVHTGESQDSVPVRISTLHKQPVTCPTCRTACDGWFEDKNADRRVKNVEVFCTNSSCKWKGSLCHLADHKAGRGCEGCQYEPVFCTLGCGEKVIRKYLEEHRKNACLLRLKKCEYCQWLGTHKSMNNHYSECRKYPIPCPNNCGKKNIPVQEVEGHLQECPEQEIKCTYSDLGCREVFKRKTTEDHHKSSQDAHLHFALARVSLLTQAFIEVQRIGPSTIASASSCTGPLSLVNRPWLENTKLFPSMPWIIRFDQFSKKKKQNGVRWTSDPFFTKQTGYKFHLRVYAAGHGEKGKDHISVYTALQRGPNDDILSWPFDKTVEVTLLNQLEDKFHHSDHNNFKSADLDCTQIESGAESATGYGEQRFYSHTGLRKSEIWQYLKDDCLFFMIKLK